MPQASLLFIHGAATGAWVWDLWRREMAALGWQVNVLDLRGHGRSLPSDLSTVTMEDYVADVASVTVQIEAAQGVHPIIAGWSMGGMVAMMYATMHAETPALLLIEPNMPLEIAGRASAEHQRRFSGAILHPDSFGVFPNDVERSREMLFDLTDEELTQYLSRCEGAEESGIAFRQNLRGISIPEGSIACPSLALYGDVDSRADVAGWSKALAGHLAGETLSVPGASHWGIVCHGRAVAEAAPGVDRWLRRVAAASKDRSVREGEGES
jgi:pimeloyl-ACP methyl ester carboxylesterase